MNFLSKVLLILITLTLLVSIFNYKKIDKTPKHIPSPPPRYAWTTIANGPEYSKAALILGYSLKRVNTKHELVLLTSDEETQENLPRFDLLRKVWDRIVHVSPLKIKFNKPEEVVDDFVERVPSFFLKITTLELTEYDKIAILGSDYIILKNIDKAFGCPAPCGVYDTWMWSANSKATGINGDMMILKPSKSDFDGLLDQISKIPTKELASLADETGSGFGPYDQGLFSYYYGSRWSALAHHIGGVESLPVIAFRPYIWDPKYIHAIHYAQTRPKPWQISNLTHNYAWENSIFRESFELYGVVEKDLVATLDQKSREIYDTLSYIEFRTVCDPGVCGLSQALRDAGATVSSAFELNYAKNRWKFWTEHFEGLVRYNSKNYIAKLRLKFCQKKLIFFQKALYELTGKDQWP
eukprot:TRINITY_DN1847_c0_g1_i1.p1 TRINITY_DN1847_c0_g1~~TRINITY_DN1847_c0_g1_i1.p1  ORF type:complete len:410 (-),score=48.00 TRINITY_DN1847_c0_g1_i1:3-1232(-)